MTEPLHPERVAAFKLSNVGAVFLHQNYVCVRSQDSYSRATRLALIDVANPAQPSLAATWEIPRAREIAFAGNHAYVTIQQESVYSGHGRPGAGD